MNSSFGQLLRRARQRLDLDQGEVAGCIYKPDGQSISGSYLNDLEHNRRAAPSEVLLPQFAAVLEIPLDLLYCSLGKLPPDIHASSASDEQVLVALQAFRQVLSLDPHQGTRDTSRPRRYVCSPQPTTSWEQYDVLKDWRSGLFIRRRADGSPTAASYVRDLCTR